MRFSDLKIVLLSLLLLVSLTSVSFALEEFESDVPCTCVFNLNRSWNPKQITYNGKIWVCEHYNADGTCAKVRSIGDAPATEETQSDPQ